MSYMQVNWKQISACVSLAALLALAGCGSGSASSRGATDSAGPADTVAAAASTMPTTTVPLTAQPDSAVWPAFDAPGKFSDPLEVAKAFATEYLGFAAPVVGEFDEGGADSGRVPVQASADGPTTNISLRRIGSTNRWWVAGAFTSDIQLQSVSTGDTVTSPLELTGASSSFEGVVNVEVRGDGEADPLLTTTVMGGSGADVGVFTKTATFNPGDAKAGAIVLLSRSAKDGSTVAATVVRVKF